MALPRYKSRFHVPNVGHKLATPKSFNYTQTGKACHKERIEKGGCAVELVFKQGKPNLRLCTKRKEPGFLVPVSSPREAARVAREICLCVQRTGKHQKCLPKGAPVRIGRTRRKDR